MIRSVTVTNHLGESVTMELRFPEKSGFLIRGIDGLGPCKSDINTNQNTSSDGGSFNSSRVTSRTIVFSLGFLGTPSIEDTRQLSYKYFPIKKRIEMIFETDNRVSWTYGYVESNSPDIFSAGETASISIVCPDSYFYSLDSNFTLFSSMSPMFEFPFSNESLVNKLMEMGDLPSTTQKALYYPGDAAVGIVIRVHAIGSATDLKFTNVLTRETVTVDTTKLTALTGSAIVGGDDIVISTIKGNKFVILQRGGDFINILNCLNKYDTWFQIEKGDNVFLYEAATGITNLQVTIENQIAYEGL